MYMQPRHYQTARLPNLQGLAKIFHIHVNQAFTSKHKNTFTARPCLESCAPTTDKVKKITRFFLFVLRRVQRNRKRKVGSSPAPIPSFGPGRGFRPNSGRGCKGKKNSVVPRQHVFTTEQISGILQTLEKRKKTSLTFHRKKLNVLLTVG